MSQKRKRTATLLLVGTLISLVFLAGSLSNLELHAGTPLPSVESHYPAQQATAHQIQTYSFTLLPGILGLILLLVITYVLVSLITFVNLKWLVPWLFRFGLALAALLIFLIILSYIDLGPTGASEWMLEVVPASSSGISTSPLGSPPKEFIWFVAIAFTLAAGLLIIKIFGKQMPSSPREDLLLQQAKNAMHALQAGKDFENVIIQCYLRMTHALQVELGIERSHEMTAREFQDWLEFKGWPGLPVQKLTNLFEKARYGQQILGENDEMIALESLREIIQFAESTKDEAPPK